VTRALACAALALLLAPADDTWRVTFTDVAAQAGLTAPSIYGGVDRKRFIVETNGAGVAFLDYDNDGWIDALVLNGVRLQDGTRHVVAYAPAETPVAHLYHNEKNGAFTDVSARAGLRASGWASSVCAGDYDNDGFLDLFVTYYGQNVLYHNRGNGTFEDVTARARLPAGGTRWDRDARSSTTIGTVAPTSSWRTT
jgi:enediyne biosynthesis protein E4